MKIDLMAYADELRYWIEAFDPFIDHASKPALGRLVDELENGRDRQCSRFAWKTTSPILTTPADRYDGKDKTSHVVSIGWEFHAAFDKIVESKKPILWDVTQMVTHIRVFSFKCGNEVLHFHHDMKNKEQLGPHIHMQFSEDYLKATKPFPIAVPRFPSAALLPTDCLDFVLSEFFPHKWPKSQSNARGLKTLQKRQQDRLLAMTKALAEGWSHSRRTPLAAIQEAYMPDLQIA